MIGSAEREELQCLEGGQQAPKDKPGAWTRHLREMGGDAFSRSLAAIQRSVAKCAATSQAGTNSATSGYTPARLA